jgi:hypothetical protein
MCDEAATSTPGISSRAVDVMAIFPAIATALMYKHIVRSSMPVPDWDRCSGFHWLALEDIPGVDSAGAGLNARQGIGRREKIQLETQC